MAKKNTATKEKMVEKGKPKIGLYSSVIGAGLMVIGLLLLIMNLQGILMAMVGLVLLYFGLKILGGVPSKFLPIPGLEKL